MSIQKLKKITLYGITKNKQLILKQLQELGCMHLIPLTDKKTESQILAQATDVNEALTWLERSPKIRRQIKEKNTHPLGEIVHDVLENKARIREVIDARDKLETRIKEVRPWGEFQFPERKSVGDQLFWFYVLPLHSVMELESIKYPWQIVATDDTSQLAYIIIISKNEPPKEILPVARSRVGSVPLSHLETSLNDTEYLLEDLYTEREILTRWCYLLKQRLAAKQDASLLAQANNGTLDEEPFFLLQGWIAKSDSPKLEAFCLEQGIAALIENPEKNDSPPTLLKKKQSVGGGADALGFFQTPNYHSWDPGNVVFYSFSLFFAMIMSDFFYSFIFGLIIFICRAKLKKTHTGLRLMNLGYFMSGAGMVWGIIIGSYFGTDPTATWLKSLAFININDYNSMMKLSVIIGVAHLAIANIMSAWVNRFSSTCLASIGWAATMIGGLVTWLDSITQTPPENSTHLVGISIISTGAVLVFLFSSTRKISNFSQLLLRLIDGFKSIYNITAAFGDVLSYMRLFALGLSGASLAMTFNTLASQALLSDPVLGVLFSGLILILGHTLNFALCIMSGIVHGMRLNVIEFVNWGLSDEGYPFKAFSKKED